MKEEIKQEKLIFTTSDNEEIELFIVDNTTLNGCNYLLVADSDSDEDEANAMILKEVTQEDDTTVYQEIDDEVEFEAVAGVFSEQLEDADIEY